ncbi:MAG: AsmA family protein [Paracoccaceae bacterium]
MRRLFTVLRWALGLTLLLAFAVWAVLETAVFSELRRTAVSKILTREIGQPIFINDDVQVSFKGGATAHISGLVLPSEHIAGVNLAELKSGSFDFDLWRLFKGDLRMDNLKIDGLHVNLLTQEDKTNSWTDRDPQPDKETKDNTGEKKLLEFLLEKTVVFEDIRLAIENNATGFEFNYILDTLTIKQLEQGDVVEMTGSGTLNGQLFEISNKLKKNDTFTTKITLGSLIIETHGTSSLIDGMPHLESDFSFNVASLKEMFGILLLDVQFEGTAKANTHLSWQRGTLQATDIETHIMLKSGRSMRTHGSIGNIFKMSGIDLLVNSIFQPEGTVVKKATSFRDVKITEFSTHVVSAEGGGFEYQDLLVKTNFIDQKFNTLGPISFAGIKRTEDGALQIDKVNFQMGPEEAPYVIAQGSIKDVFELQGIEIKGVLAASADIVLRTLDLEKAEEFGNVHADFNVSDASGELSLTSLKLNTENSDLWSLTADLSVGDVTKLADLQFDMDLNVSDSARFLEALDLKPIDAGKIGFSAKISGSGAQIGTKAVVTVGKSHLDVTLANTGGKGTPVIRGGMTSDSIDIKDLKNVTAAGIQLASLKNKEAAKPEVKVKPLVIKPVVKPLVIEEDAKLVDTDSLLKELDLEFGVHIKKLLGQSGISGINSELDIKEGKLNFGPLEATYAGGFFKASAAMDLINAPQTMQVSGSTSGWDFGEILDAVGLGIDAHGKIEGRFNLSGNIKSARGFLHSMNGSATVYMTNGSVATSLLELSGLGIFPWLFSQERKQGYTDIVCAVAPLRIEPGRAYSDAVVVETKSVQLVVKGIADWKNDTINVLAEPRPIGRPLARSAWPFEVKGKLSDPKFKVIVGGIAAKRAPKGTKTNAQAKTRKPCTIQ